MFVYILFDYQNQIAAIFSSCDQTKVQEYLDKKAGTAINTMWLDYQVDIIERRVVGTWMLHNKEWQLVAYNRKTKTGQTLQPRS